MPAWLLIALVVLATHRLTRLAVVDEIPLVRVPRDRMVNWLDPLPPGTRAPWGAFGRSIAYLLGCPWCMSVWIGGALTALVAWRHGLPDPWLVWPAASSITGWVASAEAAYEQRYELRARDLHPERAGARR